MKWAFWQGFFSAFCIFPPRRARTKFGRRFLQRSDAEALRSDWEAVGADMRRAMEAYDAEAKE